MAYLITHIAIFLVFAQLLGLLLGWLLWGYMARQRGQEVVSLRQRIADLQLTATRMALAAEPRTALPEAPGVLIEGDLPEMARLRGSFFQEEIEEPVAEPVARAKPVSADLEAEVKESRLQFLEQQARELESIRDRLPLMQADLSDAIAGRRAAESKFQEVKNDFEVRSSNLLAQIRDFEKAAQEWDRQRDELERGQLARDKELSTVKAHLRDLQNSQRPQVAEPLVASPTAASIELADLRDRYQRAIKERDSIAEELEFWKQNDDNRSGDSSHLLKRVSELEEAVRIKDATLQEQVARIESLLWRVAELEPFAAGAARMEEHLKRQESEIAGHMAMHSENAEQIRGLQIRIVQFESDASKIDALTAEMNLQVEEYARKLESAKQNLAAAERSLSEHDVASAEQIRILENRIAGLESDNSKTEALTAEIQSQAEEYARELQSTRQNLAAAEKQIQGLQNRIAELEAHNSQSEILKAEVQRQADEKAKELNAANQALAAAEKRLSDHDLASAEQIRKSEQRIAELEELAAGVTAESATLKQRLDQYTAELQSLTENHASQIADLQQTLRQRDDEVAAQKATHQEHENLIVGLRAHISELELTAQKVAALEKALIDRDTEIRGLLSAHGDMHREMQGWKDHSAKLQPVANQVPVLESILSDRESEIARLKQADSEKDSQLTSMVERLNAVSARLAWHQQRLQELEPLAAKVPELNRREEESLGHFKMLEEKHQTELMRLKVNSAQRLRRLRQGITGFKG